MSLFSPPAIAALTPGIYWIKAGENSEKALLHKATDGKLRLFAQTELTNYDINSLLLNAAIQPARADFSPNNVYKVLFGYYWIRLPNDYPTANIQRSAERAAWTVSSLTQAGHGVIMSAIFRRTNEASTQITYYYVRQQCPKPLVVGPSICLPASHDLGWSAVSACPFALTPGTWVFISIFNDVQAGIGHHIYPAVVVSVRGKVVKFLAPDIYSSVLWSIVSPRYPDIPISSAAKKYSVHVYNAPLLPPDYDNLPESGESSALRAQAAFLNMPQRRLESDTNH